MRALRPLGIGELLDRAIVIAFENVRLFGLLGAIFAVPTIALSFHSNAATGGQIFAAMSGRKTTANGEGATDVALLIAAALLSLLQIAVTLALAAGIDAGQRVTLRGAFRRGIRRLPRVFALLVLGFATIVLVVLGGAVVVALFTLLGPYAMGIGFVFALLVFTLFSVPPLLVLELATVAVVGESTGLRASIARAFGRLRSPGRFLRALAVNAIAFVMYYSIVYGGLGLGIAAESIDRSGVLINLAIAIGGVVSTSITSTFLTVFVRDLRVRAEGYDLEIGALELEALAHDAAGTGVVVERRGIAS